MIVVFDTSTVVSAIFWPASTARRCLAGAARRRFRLAVTGEIRIVTPVELLRTLDEIKQRK